MPVESACKRARIGIPVLTVAATMVGIATFAMAQPADVGLARLPAPTGDLALGRVTVCWKDESRIEPLSPKSDPRELMVDIWYPADSVPGGAPAEYLDVAAFERALGADGLRKQLGGAYDAVRAGTVRTHAVAGAPFAHSIKRSPVLIFSPGGGMVRELYAAQLEDLASHGYVVAAISHTYDAFATVFPWGANILYTSKRWPTPPSFEGEANLNQLEWHTEDIRFVLNQLSRSDEPGLRSLPFAGHLDLARVGAFGHSFGGMAAAHACQGDRRIKACLNQDGETGMRPYYLDVRGRGMDQPFMFMERAPRVEPPTDKELAEMKVTRSRANEFLSRLKAYEDRALRSTGTTYHVILQRGATTHMDFSDLPGLAAGNVTEADMRARVMSIVRGYTRAFFDAHVRGAKAPLLNGKTNTQLVEAVERFGPGRRSNRHR
jgi:predicted dienelactone hydrolase